MAMRYTYSRPRRLARPFGEVAPIIDATNPADAIRQILDFMARNQSYRVGVPDSSFFPFSAICRLNLTFPSGAYHGTGFYIGNDTILTCGHNLFDKTPDGSSTEGATRVTVRVGQQNETTWLDTFDVTPSDWAVHPTWVGSGATDHGFDLSVIRVTHAPPSGAYFRLINYSPSADTPIAVCGYGSDDAGIDGQRQHLDIDRVRAVADSLETFDYNLQTRGGNSGSPVFVDFTNASSEMPETIPVMGVHVSTASGTMNRGVLLNPDKIEWAMGAGVASAPVFSYSRSLASLGGLPLQRRKPGMLGGLPLPPSGRQPMLRTQSWVRPLDRNWIITDGSNTGGMSVARRTFGFPTRDTSGKTSLTVRVPSLPSGGSVRWNIPDAVHKTLAAFETGGTTSSSASGTSVTLRSLAGGALAVDCMVRDASGTTVESDKFWVSSPQFVFVTLNATADTFLTGLGLGGARRAAILTEMKATMEHLYRNVNMRFIFPGDVLPAHLGVGANAVFPGGVQVQPSVIYAEVLGDESINDPEGSLAAGAPTPYVAGSMGRNHAPGEMAPPFDHHTLARGLVNRFAGNFPEVAGIETRLAAGGLNGAQMDMAGRFYGRLMGENLAHEVAHFAVGAFQAHTAGGLTEEGTGRTLMERTGMALDPTTAPFFADTGRGAMNDLPADVLHAFEEHLPVNPPLDSGEFAARGRVGSFSRTQGWVNDAPVRPMDAPPGEITVHLPGATVLDGWQARAFVAAIETAFRTTLASNPAFVLLTPFVNIDAILAACDHWGLTLAVGLTGGGGLGIGGGAGGGIIFAPGDRIGFFGSGSGIIGMIYSAGLSMQLTLIDGGPEKLSGDGFMAGISVATIGWFDAGALDAPIAAHAVFDAAHRPIGFSFEFGVSAGMPVISLIEAYGQRTKTVTTMSRHRYGHSLSVPPGVLDAAVAEAVADGASPSDAQAFLVRLCG